MNADFYFAKRNGSNGSNSKYLELVKFSSWKGKHKFY